jgi:hypothetical protein
MSLTREGGWHMGSAKNKVEIGNSCQEVENEKK